MAESASRMENLKVSDFWSLARTVETIRSSPSPETGIIKSMPLGIYISVPFCLTKCSYCNFASDVFSRSVFVRYVDRVCHDIANARGTVADVGGVLASPVDSIYLGGGTPSVLDPEQLEKIFAAVREEFEVLPEAEVTVECAPGTLSAGLIDTLVKCGVNRVSLGVQSFVDEEARAVGRLHKCETVLEEIARLRTAGISNINIDLIAGLPHQTAQSWQNSLNQVIASGAPHVSVYMLEIDEDSRLGRELIAGGTRYHAHFVPDENATADSYLAACERLEAAGIPQYEISNFARPGFASRHNLKYWTRQPYLGFGLDAHSMLPSSAAAIEAVRFSTSDSLEKFSAGAPIDQTPVHPQAAVEETFFLGLRLNRGVDLESVAADFGADSLIPLRPVIGDLTAGGFLQPLGNSIRLTARGRLLSNEVFQKFLSAEDVTR